MTRDEAHTLVVFINRCDDRYRAEALHLGESEAWVILTDRNTGGNPPPIVELAAFLSDERSRAVVTPECRQLLADFLRECEADGGAETAGSPEGEYADGR